MIEQIKLIDEFCDDKIHEMANDDDISFREFEINNRIIEEVRDVSKMIADIISGMNKEE
tara:strand:+ start:246 stop:422 length:177 start_codon:yes stop_codon:yes gene_type:complete